MTLSLVGGPYISFPLPYLFQTFCSIFSCPANTAILVIEYAHISLQV